MCTTEHSYSSKTTDGTIFQLHGNPANRKIAKLFCTCQGHQTSIFSNSHKKAAETLLYILACLGTDKLLLGISALGLLLQGVLAVEGVEGAVSGLLARHEHGSEGGSHAGGAVKLGHLQHVNSSIRNHTPHNTHKSVGQKLPSTCGSICKSPI